MKLSNKEASFWLVLIKEVILTKDFISNTSTSNTIINWFLQKCPGSILNLNGVLQSWPCPYIKYRWLERGYNLLTAVREWIIRYYLYSLGELIAARSYYALQFRIFGPQILASSSSLISRKVKMLKYRGLLPHPGLKYSKLITKSFFFRWMKLSKC